MTTGPTIARHKSVQEVSTPWPFIDAVISKFGLISWDLAASLENCKAEYAGHHYSKETDALIRDWHALKGLLWLNPPYANIGPWARKCADESAKGAEILLLVPGSVGSKWFWDYVYTYSTVYCLSPRISFDGKHPYPKDLILCHYGPNRHTPQHLQLWRWANQYR